MYAQDSRYHPGRRSSSACRGCPCARLQVRSTRYYYATRPRGSRDGECRKLRARCAGLSPPRRGTASAPRKVSRIRTLDSPRIGTARRSSSRCGRSGNSPSRTRPRGVGRRGLARCAVARCPCRMTRSIQRVSRYPMNSISAARETKSPCAWTSNDRRRARQLHRRSVPTRR